jgi:hypothetical protein
MRQRISVWKRTVQRYVHAFGRKGSLLIVVSLLLSLSAMTGRVALHRSMPTAVSAASPALAPPSLPVRQNEHPVLSVDQAKPVTSQSSATTKPLAGVSALPAAPAHKTSYRMPVCTYRSIQYKTVYQNASWLDAGKTQEFSGMNGQEKICNPADGGAPVISTVYPPYDKKVYVGTYVNPTSATVPAYTPAPTPPKNYSVCNQFSGTGAYEQCIYAVSQQ